MDKPRLEAIREDIDAIDTNLLELLNKRAALSLEVGRIKADTQGVIFKPLRERDLLDGLVAKNTGPLPEEHLRIIWREILSSSRTLQRPQNVAYLGPEGTFSYFAGVEYLGHAATFQPCRDIAQIFEKVVTGQCELGVVPLENSLQGTVGVSFDLFLKHNVFIQAELFSRISHCFLSNAQDLASVRTIYSHPQALAQCGRWLRMHVPNAVLVPVESTAAAAHRATESQDAASVGHRNLADILGLNILAKCIEDETDNWTRFVIIGSQAVGRQVSNRIADKTSLLFTTPDKPGALSAILELLATNGINMRKLESRPMRGETWKYVFFADVESDLTIPKYADLLGQLKNICMTFRILGSYAAGPRLDRVMPDDNI